ncbi:Tumor necrosis factor alpha-induced protein 3 [Manis javanica]|nr:Tumor necrosis factor alpha-induced protein 3 [Manis javanica]
MLRLRQLLSDQKRFVRDASHQLHAAGRAQAQLQSAQRGDVPGEQAFEIGATVDRATRLANQMLALAKVEQLQQEDGAEPASPAPSLLDKSGARRGHRTVAADCRAGHRLLHEHRTLPRAGPADGCCANSPQPAAQRHTPHACGRRRISVHQAGSQAVLSLRDSGPGIDSDLAQRLFQPFSAGNARSSSG